MKNRAIIPLAVGLGVGLIAVKLSLNVVQRARASNNSEDMASVVVAQQLIPMGVEVKPGMLSVTKTSKTLAPQGAFDDPKKLSGRVVRTQIPKGVPVIEEMLAAPGTPAGMASLVPSGYRAVAVKVDEDSSVGGFLKPGCRVDVAAIMCVRSAKGPSETISRVILQDVMVGAVGQSLTGDTASNANLSRSVTLLVKPEEVAVLHLAATQGKIRLAMRHYEDQGSAGDSIARENELDGNAPEPQHKTVQDEGFLSGLAKLLKPGSESAEATKPPWAIRMSQRTEPAEVRPPYVVTVLKGSAVESVTFESSDSVRRIGGATRSSQLASASDSALGKTDQSSKVVPTPMEDPAAVVQDDAPAPPLTGS
jgi:pilus assembly protein CpaB